MKGSKLNGFLYLIAAALFIGLTVTGGAWYFALIGVGFGLLGLYNLIMKKDE